jgi:hypothetical protein
MQHAQRGNHALSLSGRGAIQSKRLVSDLDHLVLGGFPSGQVEALNGSWIMPSVECSDTIRVAQEDIVGKGGARQQSKPNENENENEKRFATPHSAEFRGHISLSFMIVVSPNVRQEY